MKKLLAAMLALTFMLCAAASAFAAEKADRSFTGGMFKLATTEDFAAGELDGLVIDETAGDGALTLAEGAATGTYTSDVIGVEPFEYLVASWNADMPAGTKLEVFARAYVDMKGEWSGWMSWGTWSSDFGRTSVEDEDALAYIDVDTFTVKGTAGETASLVQMKAVLTASEDGAVPVLRQLAATYKNTLDGQSIKPEYWGEDTELPESVRLDTPAYSQQTRKSSIAGEMCSATTICVLLNDRGEDAIPEEIALLDYDKLYDGFGNWSYSVGVAGAYGYDAYCQYGDLDLLRQELAHGYSVGLSVRYSNSTGGSYPYLENAPISGTAGHLITITGYETVDGVDYFYSSDSAASTDEACIRRYRADQLDKAWSGKLAYIVHDKENEAALAPNRIQAELVPAEGVEDCYTLTVNGEAVELLEGMDVKMLRADGGGTITYYIEEQEGYAPEGAKVTTANARMKYSISSEGGLVKIKPKSVLNGFEGDATLRIFIMLNNGVTYEATLALEAYVEATPAPTEAPAAVVTEAPAATPEPTAEPEKEAFISKENGRRLIIVAIVAIVGAIAARIWLDKNEQKKKEEQAKNKKKHKAAR